MNFIAQHALADFIERAIDNLPESELATIRTMYTIEQRQAIADIFPKVCDPDVIIAALDLP